MKRKERILRYKQTLFIVRVVARTGKNNQPKKDTKYNKER